MSVDREYLEYTFRGLSGVIYRPYFFEDKWYLMEGIEFSFYDIVYLCAIPDDEALILKLKYGSGIL